ncbi:myc box-dependent-interacting protein 1-like isoform X2 [Stegodyphus dumicola]|nr:myc box-dependent-interacting protein 1-like isoform X2 [Stegodyphus dumicola]
MQASRKSLMDTICELYEPCWVGLDYFLTKSETLNQNFEDFCEKINNQLLTPVASYIAQFPELNNKIAKRNRKLLDYDNCRHNLQNLQTLKKREEAKIAKAKEQLDEARNLFEVINSELHDELPALYDSRVSFFVSHLQCLYLAEAQFHSQDSVAYIELNSILEALDEACRKGTTYEPNKADVESQGEKGDDSSALKSTTLSEFLLEKEDGSSSGSASGSAVFSTPPTTAVRSLSSDNFDVTKEDMKEDESLEVEAAKEPPPTEHRILYQVQGTYKYTAEDVDELSFNVGDIIDVIAYEDPDEQEEGWLMGIFNGRKGLFPANFTSRI